MLNQFSRTVLLYGPEVMDRFARARVAVFGIGGVGGYTAEALVRSGIGAIDLIDDDRIWLTNLNRQVFAARATVGQYKVDAARARLLEIITHRDREGMKCANCSAFRAGRLRSCGPISIRFSPTAGRIPTGGAWPDWKMTGS